ncbi:SGNH/GDSL hydrolase family protein [Catenulispora sp. NL8]|uniref:SGNH/GDSL hydrolase family protein n=1 Tax=Catenulispora pinistramenti TaxID=2705254 RepID=A0ABS5KSB3_9ACTN|nr:GDSL-type esterase/lipase family protein [Catenulispora pinistramenti]MBS2548941.1 SGNH/GDSL hydrolase family protein [Catenulispora pinistramenti]
MRTRIGWAVAAFLTALATAVAPAASGSAAAHAQLTHPTTATAATAAAAAATGPWTGTWAVSPQSGGAAFNQQTLRQIVHTSIGGTSARVQISNAFGSQPLAIADVHIAQRSSGAGIVAGTDQIVTFGGQSSTTIAAGALAVSDPIAFAVPALSDVAVSIYLPQGTGASTYHQQGSATNYIASGDVSGSQTLTNPQTTGSYFFLTNLDVQNAASQGAVVTLGASITDGYASSFDADRRWPNDLAVRLAQTGHVVGVLNQGISGNRLLVDGAGPSALHRFAQDVLAQPGVRWVIFAVDPINDLGSTSPPPSSDELIAGLQQLIAAAHQNGVRFLCSTLTPYQGAGYWTQQGETAREAFNAYVRSAGNGCDAVVDQDAATHDPANPTMYLPAYDSGDHLHPNDAGLRAIANAVNLALFGAPASTPVVSLRAHANGDIVTADNAGAAPLIANRTAIGPWETFDLLSNADGSVSLRAHANGDIVSADNAGSSPLIANRTAIGPWESFDLLNNADGSVSFRAHANGNIVTADNAGSSPLIADRTAIGGWESFDLIPD